MRCPLCQELLGEGEDLQFHFLLDCSAYTANETTEDDKNGERLVGVRFRWAKVNPCVERIVHLISSLSGSIPLHWSEIEGLYESSLTSVPVGTHSCQLAIGGDVLPVQDFQIEHDTDVMYIIPIEQDEETEDTEIQEDIVDEHDDPVGELLASRSYQRDEHTTTEIADRYDDDDDNDGNEHSTTDLLKDDHHGNPLELSPLYKELLQHQVLHGEPSWIPTSGSQSPTSSDQEIEEIIRDTRTELEPPLLTGKPATPDTRLLKSPIPVKPFEIETSNKTKDNTDQDKEKDDLASSSSGTFSGSSSKGSCDQRQSPPVESDSSDEDGALQEQSLQESLPQMDELPCPYSGSFITSGIADNAPAQTAPGGNAPVKDDHPVICHESRDSTGQQTQHVRPMNDQINTRASPLGRNNTVTDQSEISLSSPNQRLGIEIGQTGVETNFDQPLRSNGRPPSTGSITHSEPRASPRSRHDSGASYQSEPRASPHSRHDSGASNQSEPRASPHSRHDSGASNQSEPRASPHSRHDSGASNQSEPRTSPQVRPSSSKSGQSETRTSPHARPGSAGSSQSDTRASHIDPTHDRPTSTGSIGQSGTRGSPVYQAPISHDRPLSAGSDQSRTRAIPVDHAVDRRTSDPSATMTSPRDRPGTVQSDTTTITSPHARPLSARSSQSERRDSPRDRSTIDQSEIRASPHARPSSARSAQSEPRPSPLYYPSSSDQIMRRYSGPSGFSGLSQRILTPPVLDVRTTHIEMGGSLSNHHSRTSPLEQLPSPSEPSPSISQRSSARSLLQDKGMFPGRPHNPMDEVTHSQDTGTFSRGTESGLPVDYSSSRERQRQAHGTDNGIPGDHTLPSERHTHMHDSRTLHQHPSHSAFVPTTSRTGSSHGPSRDHTDRTSVRHHDNSLGAAEDLMIVGHSINSSAERGQDGEQRKGTESQKQTMEESFAKELSKRTASYEKEIKELKALNEELCQQLLSLEAAAALTEQDINSSKSLERMVKTLTGKLQEREKEVAELKKRVTELEKENKEMKDEQESLKTINKLTYEDLNKVNSDLLAERSSEIRRKTYGSPMRSLTEDTIPKIETMNQTLRDKVNRLETEKRDLKSKYYDTKMELEKTKAEKSVSEFRLTKAKSEADLAEKFDRYVDYRNTPDLDVTNQKTTASSGLGSSRCTWSDNNADTTYKIGTYVPPRHTLLNGSTRDYDRQDKPVNYGSSRTFRGTGDNELDRERQTYSHTRHRSLSSESSGSSLLEYEYGANIRIPYETTSYRSRDDKVELRGTGSGRKVRPHSYDGSRPVSEYARDNYKHHLKSSTYSAPLHQDYTSTTPYDYTRSSLNSSFNSDSSYGTTPYTTTTNVAKTRDHSKPFLPVSSGEIRLGKRVVVMRTCGNVGRGVVRYVGPLPNRPGSFVGVELDYPEGKHDGSFAGRQFFRCKPNRGIFVKFDKVVMCYN